MGTGQTMMTLGALMLMSALILRINGSLLFSDSEMYDSKFGVLAVSLATSIIEEANSKTYDEATSLVSIVNVNDLTSTENLGPEWGESYPDFDDFDDFDGFARIDSTIPSAIFSMSCDVDYVASNNLDGISNSPTWHKRITVAVTSQSMEDTIRLQSIFSYWFFR